MYDKNKNFMATNQDLSHKLLEKIVIYVSNT